MSSRKISSPWYVIVCTSHREPRKDESSYLVPDRNTSERMPSFVPKFVGGIAMQESQPMQNERQQANGLNQFSIVQCRCELGADLLPPRCGGCSGFPGIPTRGVCPRPIRPHASKLRSTARAVPAVIGGLKGALNRPQRRRNELSHSRVSLSPSILGNLPFWP